MKIASIIRRLKAGEVICRHGRQHEDDEEQWWMEKSGIKIDPVIIWDLRKNKRRKSHLVPAGDALFDEMPSQTWIWKKDDDSTNDASSATKQL